jgi:hypothetical protein
VALANYRDFRDNVSEFAGLAAYQFIGANLAGGTEPLSIGGQLVTGNKSRSWVWMPRLDERSHFETTRRLVPHPLW